MIACLRTFLSRCTHAQWAKLLETPQRHLRPLVPKPIAPPSSSHAEDNLNAVPGPVQRSSLLARPQPHPPPPTKTRPPQPPVAKKPLPQSQAPERPLPQASAFTEPSQEPPAAGKRKRVIRTSIDISGGSDSYSDASLSDSDSDSDTERASHRRKKPPHLAQS